MLSDTCKPVDEALEEAARDIDILRKHAEYRVVRMNSDQALEAASRYLDSLRIVQVWQRRLNRWADALQALKNLMNHMPQSKLKNLPLIIRAPSEQVQTTIIKLSQQSFEELLQDLGQLTTIYTINSDQKGLCLQLLAETQTLLFSHRANKNKVAYDQQVTLLNHLIRSCTEIENEWINGSETLRGTILQWLRQRKDDSGNRQAIAYKLNHLNQHLNEERAQVFKLLKDQKGRLDELKKYFQLSKQPNCLDKIVEYSNSFERAVNGVYEIFTNRIAEILNGLLMLQKDTAKKEEQHARPTRTITGTMESMQKIFSDRVTRCIRPLEALDPDLIASIMDTSEAQELKGYLENSLTKEQQAADYRGPSHFLSIFGPQGVAKSVLAEAVGLITNFDEAVFIKGAVVGNEYSNSASNCINDLFAPMLQDDSKQWLVIIDEIDAIDGDQQEGRQRAFRGMATIQLNTALDSCSRKKNITVLITTWRPERLPADMKTRFHVPIILKNPDNEFYMKILLQYLVGKTDLKLDPTVDIAKLNALIPQLSKFNMNIRDVQGITDMAYSKGLMRRTDKSKPVVVTLNDIKKAIIDKKTANEFRGVPKDDDPVEQQKEQTQIARKQYRLARNQARISTGLGVAGLGASVVSAVIARKQLKVAIEALKWQKITVVVQAVLHFLSTVAAKVPIPGKGGNI